MKESQVEKYLHKKIEELGGTTRKFTSPGRVGVPDRICFLPNGRVIFVEVKTNSGKLSVRQEREIEQLRSFGAECRVVRGHNGVDLFVNGLVDNCDTCSKLQQASGDDNYLCKQCTNAKMNGLV